MGRLRNILEKYIQENQMFEMIEYFKDNNIQYLYPTKKYNFLLNIKNNNMKGGNEYTLDLKINKVKYTQEIKHRLISGAHQKIIHMNNFLGCEVNIDEYSDMIYTQSNNKSLGNKEEYQKINVNDIKMTENSNKKTISFIKFNSIKDERGDYKEDDLQQNNVLFCEALESIINNTFLGDHCAVLIIDFVKKKSIIQSLNNYTDCVRCLSNNEILFKSGDILTQIMIIMSIKNNLKYIELTDNSYLLCKNSKLLLIHLRTMTKGNPFYSKYGFIPLYEKNIYEHNINIYKQQKTLTKEQIIKYLYYRDFDNNKDAKILNYINNILIPRLNPIILVSEFINSIIGDNNKEACSLLYNIYMKIYEDIGYYKYENKKFILDLKNNIFRSEKKLKS